VGGDPGAKRWGSGDPGAVREAVEAAEALARSGVVGPAGGFEPAAGAGAGPAAGGAAVGQAAAAGMAQAQQGQLATFAGMLMSYGAYNSLTDDEKRAYLQARASFEHPPTEPHKDGPGDITVMAKALQAALKVATAITTSLTYGTNEDIGVALCVLRSMARRLIWRTQRSRTRCRPTALRFAFATTCAEKEPEQSSRTARRCGKTRDTWKEEAN
jgi:hypothetical protein